MKRVICILITLSILFCAGSLFAAANTVTSTTGVRTGTDPNFVVTYHPVNNFGVVLFIKYTKSTEASITLTFETINRSISATDEFLYSSLAGTALSAYTMVLTASGNYRIPLPLISTEKTIIANIVFATAAQGGAVVANFAEP